VVVASVVPFVVVSSGIAVVGEVGDQPVEGCWRGCATSASASARSSRLLLSGREEALDSELSWVSVASRGLDEPHHLFKEPSIRARGAEEASATKDIRVLSLAQEAKSSRLRSGLRVLSCLWLFALGDVAPTFEGPRVLPISAPHLNAMWFPSGVV
jgi:hypothetical protein